MNRGNVPMSLVSIVIPVYNNAASLADLWTRFQELVRANSTDRFEFLFVDDGSFDDSFEFLRSLTEKEEHVCLIKLSRNFGSNAALLAGLEQSHGDVVGAIAADLQDPPALFSDMLARWRQGSKVVLAARASRDDPLLTSLFANVFYVLFRRFALPTMPRHGFDFFLIDRQVCNLIKGMPENNGYVVGLILWLGFQPQVIYYNRQGRAKQYGTSMWSFAKKLKYFVDSFVAFSYVPIRAASLLGITLSILGVIYAVIVIITRLVGGVQVEGWTSLMVVLLIVSGAQLVIMGILGEYLWRALEESRRRPRFVVQQTVRSSASDDLRSHADSRDQNTLT